MAVGRLGGLHGVRLRGPPAELASRQQAFVEAAGAHLLFAEQRVYVLALVGFIVFYGLEHMVLTSRAAGRMPAMSRPEETVYRRHVGGFAVYSWLIGYLLVERAASGPFTLLLYGGAMAFHFLVVDHALRHEHAATYDRGGRWLLAGSVLVGGLTGVAIRIPEPWLARLFAFVAGGVVITSTMAELPAERDGQFGPFCLGAALSTVLLLGAGWRG